MVMNLTRTAVRDEASDYLQRGWQVIRLKPRSKRPALEHA